MFSYSVVFLYSLVCSVFHFQKAVHEEYDRRRKLLLGELSEGEQRGRKRKANTSVDRRQVSRVEESGEESCVRSNESEEQRETLTEDSECLNDIPEYLLLWNLTER